MTNGTQTLEHAHSEPVNIGACYGFAVSFFLLKITLNKKNMKTKIYEIQINGEKEWVCADTVIEALKAYCSITDMSLVDFENDDEILEVPKEKWSEMNIVDTEGEYDEETGYPIIMTFAEYMEKESTSADIIATTNY